MDFQTFWLCFVPLFVAVDAIGVIPLFISLTSEIEKSEKSKIIITSVLTAMVVGLLFLFVGAGVLRLLGITVADFMIAGGIVLFMIAIADLMTYGKPLREIQPESLGPVPLGVPLIAGPAVLTTIMLLVREYGMLPTALATVANILFAGLCFVFSGLIMRILGDSGSKIFSKIANLFLAAIAVMMVRKGLITAFEGL